MTHSNPIGKSVYFNRLLTSDPPALWYIPIHNRSGENKSDFDEIGGAISAGTCLITDDKTNRLRA